MQKTLIILTLIIMPLLGVRAQQTFPLDQADLSNATSGWKTPQRNMSIEAKPIQMSGKVFNKGIGVGAPSDLSFDLAEKAVRFMATVGIDDAAIGIPGAQPVRFLVMGDGDTLYNSGVMRAGDTPKKVDVNLKNVHLLQLLVSSAGNDSRATFANWADAQLVSQTAPISFDMTGKKPIHDKKELTKVENPAPAYILTPPVSKKAKINGAKVVGVRPGSPFLYYIPVTGERPIKYAVQNLPVGLSLDVNNGIISGKIAQQGEYKILLKAENKHSKSQRELLIKCGNELALTPPMGWNSWNAWGPNIDQKKIKETAEAMKSSGLADHGWMYVNIDDGWQGKRDKATKAITCNERFPDIKRLSDYVHSLGLKIGIYSTPWATSYMNLPGGSADNLQGEVFVPRRDFGVYPFHKEDANQYAAWGIDYLKYDWAGVDYPHAQAMWQALQETNRDMLFSLSGAIKLTNARLLSGVSNLWRVNNDIEDNWPSIYTRGFYHDRWNKYQRPGHWNDPDMLVVGQLSWGKGMRPNHLTADEQYTHMSLWALYAAPLLLGCDLTKLDDFTLNLITNDEVIDINQDPLGKLARQVSHKEGTFVFAKALEDGSLAVGLFNTGATPTKVKVDWKELNIKGRKNIRNVWKQQNVAKSDSGYEATVAPHGVELVRIF